MKSPGGYLLRHPIRSSLLALAIFIALPISSAEEPAEEKTPWLLGTAYRLPGKEYANQESGYFSIIEGKDKKIYVGTAKYGVNSYLLEFDPLKAVTRMVVDVHRVLRTMVTGFAAQAKIHTRNNVGASGKIYFGTKQGYPEKGEKLTDYLGGYVMAYDPKTGETENLGLPKKHSGVISVMPDEERGKVYISTCDDGRPIEIAHFMVLDLKTKEYKDLGDSGVSYAFIVLDHRHRAYHPWRGGGVHRYDPKTDRVEKLEVTVDGQPTPRELAKDDAILNWEASPDGKSLYVVEMSTNQLFAFDLTVEGKTIPGKRLGPLLPKARRTDCRAFCGAADGKFYAAVTDHGLAKGPQMHLVSFTPGDKAPRDHGPCGIANPNFTKIFDDQGKPLPLHHTIRKEKDGTLTPWVPLGICACADGSVYIETLAPLILLKYSKDQLK